MKKKPTTTDLCAEVIVLQEQFSAYKTRYDSKVEGIETYNEVLREIELPKLRAEIQGAHLMVDRTIELTKKANDMVSESKQLVVESKKVLESLSNKIIIILAIGLLAQLGIMAIKGAFPL